MSLTSGIGGGLLKGRLYWPTNSLLRRPVCSRTQKRTRQSSGTLMLKFIRYPMNLHSDKGVQSLAAPGDGEVGPANHLWRDTQRCICDGHNEKVGGFEAVLAEAGVKAPLAGHEHPRLQDVATAPVVLEAAIVKVHGQAQRLEIESNCNTPRDNHPATALHLHIDRLLAISRASRRSRGPLSERQSDGATEPDRYQG
ncbi:hypothetical protein EYF80_007679 [Liparis tanakae]|uniref:Uncharacterized protein n=1 Tax=Liparis tanakae TaxID=230148 RepID=A0A4Z2IXP9_9TELE|nr:hypothetical protein EYF80_007679 [Liparis tanakae]